MKASTLLAVLIVLVIGVVVYRAHGGKTAAAKSAALENAVPVIQTTADLASVPKMEKSATEWQKQLTPAQYAVMRERATERAGSSPLLAEHRHGVFRCVGCDAPLFASDAKFESGTGWPSFTKPFIPANIVIAEDHTLWMKRDEVLCARCGAHLGHVFDDGPLPTGLRYCLNGVALKFEPRP